LNGEKALSPVVATIILIAVTVAVSIAIAAWMGTITFTFMKTYEQHKFTIQIPNLLNATHVTYWIGQEAIFSTVYNETKKAMPLPLNVTIQTSYTQLTLTLIVQYYNEIALNVFEDLGQKRFQIFLESEGV